MDDNKVWKEIDSRVEDKKHPQDDPNNIYDWSNKWLMQLRPDKLIHMDTGATMENPQHEYTVGGMMVQHSQCEKDLGVEIDRNLSFKSHIENKTKKANMTAGWIKRLIMFLNVVTFRLLHMSLVRTHLEYAVSIWGPHNSTQICQMEAVQERASKMVSQIRGRPYPDRLRSLDMPTLRYEEDHTQTDYDL